MESGKTKSQSSLLSRGPLSTDLPHTQSLHSRQSLYNAGTAVAPPNLPAIPSRPGSSRPQSRIASRPMSSRPVSRLDQSRPGSRVDSSRPSSRMLNRHLSADPGQRPRSAAIRPLSGGVFMRRMEHGWVAKHYPGNGASSQANLDTELEDLSDCESFDSFFNDDFDVREHSEKLDNLLSCNTLGVESKGQKRDWNAGEVGIPKFHCPRCRDHWYGITPFPCDEELARLIKEGLWYTGKGDPSKILSGLKSREQSGIAGMDGGSGSSPSSGFGGSREQKVHRVLKGENSSQDPLEMGREKSKKNKKNKRRITFKLDDRDEEGSGILDNADDGGLQSKRNSSSSRHEGGDWLENQHLETSLNQNGTTRLLSPEKNANDSTNGTCSNSFSSVDSDATHSEKDGLNSGVLESSGSNNSLTRRQRRERGQKNRGSSSNLLKTPRTESKGTASKQGSGNKGSRTQLTDEVGMGLANALVGGQGQNGGHTMDDMSLSNSQTNQTTDIDALSRTGSSEMEDRHLGQQPSRGSQSSVTSNQNRKSKMGPDHGKKVRKAGGYMRAVSPTGSEWGDPTHARPYASSTTASSQAGSTFNLLKDHENEDKTTLPPIIPPITSSKKHTVDFSKGGFDITPPWRFSYFSPSPLHAAAARPTTVASNRPRNRK